MELRIYAGKIKQNNLVCSSIFNVVEDKLVIKSISNGFVSKALNISNDNIEKLIDIAINKSISHHKDLIFVIDSNGVSSLKTIVNDKLPDIRNNIIERFYSDDSEVIELINLNLKSLKNGTIDIDEVMYLLNIVKDRIS